MNSKVLNLLQKSKGITIDSHFVYTSGKHASRYLNKMAIFVYPIYASEMGKLFADKYMNEKIDVVVAPAIGGIILSQWTAYHLSKYNDKQILSIYTEKDKGSLSQAKDSNQVFTKGNDKYIKDKNVLIVEDIVTTGISVNKVVKAVKSAGGNVVEVCAMANINPQPESINSKIIGAPFSSLEDLPVDVYDEKDCPMCRKGIPVDTTLGHGKKFLEEKAKRKF